MINIYGQPGEEEGDRLVYDVFRFLPNDWFVYAQKEFVYRDERRKPDYILIHKDVGVIVIEVKDWTEIKECEMNRALVWDKDTRAYAWRTSPVEQARTASEALSNRLKQDPLLVKYSGKLDFPYRYAGILAHLPSVRINGIRSFWGENFIFGKDDLHKDKVENFIRKIPAPYSCPMTPEQIDAVRAIIDPHLIAIDKSTGDIKGIYDAHQENVAKGSISLSEWKNSVPDPVQKPLILDPPSRSKRISFLENELPDEVRGMKSETRVRLLRGFAGTGKTDVVVLRANYLYETYPHADILVTTFNKPLLEERLATELSEISDRVNVIGFSQLCSNLYIQKHRTNPNIQKTIGLINRLVLEGGEISEEINEFGSEFVSDEIEWIKEMGLSNEERYLSAQREGRKGKSGRSLSRKNKARVFQIYNEYQSWLHDMPGIDWPDFYEKILGYLQNNLRPWKLYNTILVDEAQHFAPNWVKILLYFLKPGGSIFLCDDPSQSVYRAFSWKQKGVNVVGRTKWLRTPYRCTRQIFDAAFALIENNELAKRLMTEGGEDIVPDISNSHVKESPHLPELHRFSSTAQEKEYVRKKLEELCDKGLLPSEIAILHTQKYVLDGYQELKKKGVHIDELRRCTGMEYKAVFIPRLQELFKRNVNVPFQEEMARNQIMFYMAMTRSREYLYMLYGQKIPKELGPILNKVTHVDHEGS